MDPIAIVLASWALWMTVEVHSIPARGEPSLHRDVVARTKTREHCDELARWAESQSDMREDFLIQNGKTFRAVMTYDCRKEN